MRSRHAGEMCLEVRKKAFFFEKKNQKTFATWYAPLGRVRDSIVKVFCFFFSKKKCCPNFSFSS
jgi:hypothetical protein